jgi:hypothetical protein
MECRTVDQQYSAVLIQYSAMQCSAVQYICANTEVIAKRHLSLVTPSQQIVEREPVDEFAPTDMGAKR